MMSAEVVDLRAYRERRRRPEPAAQSAQWRRVGAQAVAAMPVPVLFFVGWVPVWTFVGVPIVADSGDA